MTKKLLFALFSIVFAWSLSSCNKNQPPPAAQEASRESFQVDPTTAGAVAGTILFEGAPPKPPKIDMGQDPGCDLSGGGDNYGEVISVEGGKLANVFVYVKSGLEGKTFAAPKDPVVLDQRGCRYLPHVLGAMAGQSIRILNSDPTMHNVHPSPHAPGNQEWNVSQQPKGRPMEKTFDQPEIMMPLQCNNHPWMKAYLNVVANPFYAISGKNGTIDLKALPPGEYTIAAVHEKLGEQTQKVTIGPKQTATVSFTFKQ